MVFQLMVKNGPHQDLDLIYRSQYPLHNGEILVTSDCIGCGEVFFGNTGAHYIDAVKRGFLVDGVFPS